MSIKHYLKKFWHFIWHDDSIASWIVSALLAFIIVKFIIYPGLGLLLGTGYPVVAVVSGSMEHRTTTAPGGYQACGNIIDEKTSLKLDKYWNLCGNWYEKENITKTQFSEFSFKNGFNTGSIIVLRGIKPEKLAIGDVIVFRNEELCRTRGLCEPVIHRIVAINDLNGTRTFQTKGDHNPDSDSSEKNIPEDHVIGKAVFKIPLLGYVKLIAVNLLNHIR